MAHPDDDTALGETEARAGSGFVSARQVADHAGVSRSAVSRTFTPGASVSTETRRRVMQAAEELGYHVNHLARGLIQRQSGIVCLVVSEVDTPLRSKVTRILTSELQKIGKVAMVLNTSGPSQDVEQALRQTLHYRADATIILSGTPPASVTRTCLDSGQQVLLINRDDRLPGPDNIAVDNAAAAEAALAAFLAAGCRRPALVNSGTGTPSLAAREAAFVNAARKAGLEPMLWREGATTYETGAAAAMALLAGAEPPDAAFCVSDLIAFGFMDAARRQFRCRIPEDICVAGFDNIEQAGWGSYALTTFDHSPALIAAAAIELIREGASGRRRQPRRITIPAPMIWRETVRRPTA